jgi:FkbM family methyltransferase
MGLQAIDWIGRALRKAGSEILRRNGIQGTWIDVGAHLGELMLWHAQLNPGLRVFALEPNLRAATALMGRASNYLVIPMAVAERDGAADFHLNEYEEANSLLPFHEEGLRAWIGGHVLNVESIVTVPTIRLDTLMALMEIDRVDFLKIDTQGMDLAVLKSAGQRLRDISKITLEVALTPLPLYSGAPSKDEVVAFLVDAGFALHDVKSQSEGQEENLTFARKPSA